MTIDFIITKAATDPTPPRRPRTLTVADAVALDIRGEALFDASCVDCGEIVAIDPQEGLLGKANAAAWAAYAEANHERIVVPLCPEHREVRLTWLAIDEQHQREMARRRRMAVGREATVFQGPGVTVAAQLDSEAPARTRQARKVEVSA